MRKLLFFLLYFFSQLALGQISKVNILEVYWDKSEQETYQYKFDIISKGDTLSPKIHKKYFFSTPELDTTITLILTVKNQKMVIENFKSYYLKGFGYLRFYFNPDAHEKCVNTFYLSGNTFDLKKSNCNTAHEASFVRFQQKGKNGFEDFFLSWYLKKSALIVS